MPSTDGPTPRSACVPEALVQQVLSDFDAYARIRTNRDSLLTSARTGPREEEHAFSRLQDTITQLRNCLRSR
ncbi:hypothetical protein [Streptomyces apricus]|uniref:Uncharacterized protein n=1 Tax=Streptomyces apricus TaxID=1828112 RepID=A0A5A9ZVJ5_9ACTN|nr:hypothetical protein [Streptomyces apricus]KAA0921229.1 hypothetical protein FGF04_37355 [Streptomyces apricus]